MWQRLALRSLGVIEEAELELEAGFTVITGETGAGKTMVVTALALLRGQRADLGLVRHTAAQARVEAEVSVTGHDRVAEIVTEAGGQVDDGTLVLARTLSAQGRSRAFAGGAAVPAGVLTAVTDELVAVHGQADQHRLTRPAQQRAALDTFAGPELAAVRLQYEPLYARWREVQRLVADLRAHGRDRLQELDLLRFGLDEIAAVEPVPGEDVALQAEESRLAHAESLAMAADQARVRIAGQAEGEGFGSAAALLADAAAALDAVAGHDPGLDELADRARSAAIEIGELGIDLAGYADAVELDPARLAAVQERRAALTSLQRKYGPELGDVLAWAAQAAARAGELAGDDETVAALEDEEAGLRAEIATLADRMTCLRRSAAGRLADLVGAELAQLSMASARLTVEVRPDPSGEPGPHGADEVELLFAANSGTAPRPLSKGASGGELSRLMLAIEVVVADRSTAGTLVFDEVDAGIGGRAAVEVGRRLAVLAESAQVIAVTHLPQVAAFARHHFRVLKDDDGNVTSSSVVRLTDADRVEELARMLAGQEDSASARAHARELLDLAHG